jgi:(p)ppGpp synthase/HD superfamily hydrolase
LGRPDPALALRVSSGIEGDDAKIAATLHDVVEDPAVTLDDVRSEGFNDAVVGAVDCSNHREEAQYPRALGEIAAENSS